MAAPYSNSLVVVGITVFSALLCEGISWLLIYRTPYYKYLISSIAKASRKLQSMNSASVAADSKMSKKMSRMETSLKESTRDLSLSKLKSVAVAAAIVYFAFKILDSLFDGAPVAKLPFSPNPFVLKLTHRGLPGTDPTDCAMSFVYFLCSFCIRINVQKFLGFSPPHAQFQRDLIQVGT